MRWVSYFNREYKQPTRRAITMMKTYFCKECNKTFHRNEVSNGYFTIIGEICECIAEYILVEEGTSSKNPQTAA